MTVPSRTVIPDVAWLPALSAELWLRTIRARMAFLAAVEALLRLRAVVLDMPLLATAAAHLRFRAVRSHMPLLAAVTALVISTSSTTSSGTVPGKMPILPTLATARVPHDFCLSLARTDDSLKKCYQ